MMEGIHQKLEKLSTVGECSPMVVGSVNKDAEKVQNQADRAALFS